MSGCVYYFCTAKHNYAFGVFAAFYARKSAERLRLVPYAAFHRIAAFGAGTYIFTDHDRLPADYRGRLSLLADRAAANGNRVLNHPLRALRRFALLRKLHESGVNRFNVHWLRNWREAERFPVFIRRESGHDKSVTALLASRDELQREAERLLAEEGCPPDLMIVEFGNARGEDGRYRKYSAYRVGDRVYAQHCSMNEDWWIKYNAEATAKLLEENVAYLRDNPHRDALIEAFALAEIEYGRADYCVVDGRVQLFEINTNPTVIQGEAAEVEDLTLFGRLHDDALLRLLDGDAGGKPTPNPLLLAGTERIAAKEVHERQMEHFRSNARQVRVPVNQSLAAIGPQ